MRHGSTLTVDGYRSTGGIEHAVADTAEQVFARLDSSRQGHARQVFLRLVKVGGSSSDDVRRPVSRGDLTSGQDTAAAVVDAFTASRLLTAGRDAIQISHEVLLRAWPRLRCWLDEDRAGHLIRQHLEDAAADWDGAEGDRSRLYRGARLHDADAWARDREQELTETARRFLAASVRVARAAKALRQGAVAALAVLALLAGTASAVAFQQRATAIQQRDQTIYDQFIADANQMSTANPSLAAQLLLAAYRMRPGRSLATRLVSTETEPLAATFGTGRFASPAGFSPDSRVLAVDDTGGASRWQVTDPARPRKLGIPPSSGQRGRMRMRLRNASDPAHPRQHDSPLAFGSPRFVRLSPDHRTAAVGNPNGTIQLWDITDPAHPHRLGPPIPAAGSSPFSAFLDSAEFSPDDRILAVDNGQGAIRLWDITDPAHPRRVGPSLASGSGHSQPDPLGGFTFSGFFTFSPDGRTLAASAGQGTIWLWNIADPAHPSGLTVHLAAGTLASMGTIALSSDGIIAAGYDDGTIRLWSIPGPLPPASPTCPAESTAFTPHGRVLATASQDGTIGLWDLTDISRPRELGRPLASGHLGSVACIAISPDGRTLAAGNDDGAVRLWDIADPAHARQLGNPLGGNLGKPVQAVIFSPDSRILAASLPDGSIRLWNTAPAGEPRPLSRITPSGAYGLALSITFSQHGRIMTAGYGLGIVRLWNITDPRNPRRLHPWLANNTGILSEAFRADGRTLATVTADGTIQLWDTTHPTRPRKLGPPLTAGNGNTATSVAFTPDGRILASGNGDGSIQLWNVTDPARPRKLGPPLTTRSNDPIQALTYSPDGRILASDSARGTITLLDPAVSYAISRICHTTSITPQQWHNLFPQLPYNPPCSR